MPIVGPLPNTLVNGVTSNASLVVANLNAIVSGVNSNANPLGTLTAPSGTRKVFNNASAPAGWVTDATITDHGLQLVSSNGGTKVSATAYSTYLGGSWSPSAHVLTASELPSHTHNATPPEVSPNTSGTRGLYPLSGGGPNVITTDGGTGGGGSHSHTNNTSWNYIACIVAQKS